MRCDTFSGCAGPGTPGAAFHPAEFGEQVAGGQVFGIVLNTEDGADVPEHLQLRAAINGIEDGSQGSTDFCRS